MGRDRDTGWEGIWVLGGKGYGVGRDGVRGGMG